MICPYCQQTGARRVLFVDNDQPGLEEGMYSLSCFVGHVVKMSKRDYYGKPRTSKIRKLASRVAQFIGL